MTAPKKRLKDSWEDQKEISEEKRKQLEAKRYYEIILPRQEEKIRVQVRELKEQAAKALNEALLVDALLNGDITAVRGLINEGLDIKQEKTGYKKAYSDFARITKEDSWFVDYTPLTAAVRGGNVDCVKEVIKAGVDINAPDGFGSPLVWAVMKGRVDILNVLIKAGADLDKTSGLSNETPQMFAEKCGRKECADALIAACAKRSLRRDRGKNL